MQEIDNGSGGETSGVPAKVTKSKEPSGLSRLLQNLRQPTATYGYGPQAVADLATDVAASGATEMDLHVKEVGQTDVHLGKEGATVTRKSGKSLDVTIRW